MTKQIIESILAPIRALIMRSRPAYKDYLGEETVEEKRVLVSGVFGDNTESSVTFTEGETYLVNLDGTEQEMAAQDVSLLIDENTIGFSNIDASKQIMVWKQSDGYSVIAGISRANQTISVYHGETLILDCTMPSTGATDFPSVVMGVATLHDESFSGFVQGEAYTIVAGEEAPVTGFVDGQELASFDWWSGWYISLAPSENAIFAEDPSESHAKFSISQNVTTIKKRYDIKLLPEDLLPKTVAKKVDVQKVQKIANAAQSTANAAQSTANAAQSTANAARSTANNAQSTAMANALWGDARNDTYMTLRMNASGYRGVSVSAILGYHLIPGNYYKIFASVYSSDQSAVWDGTQLSVGTGSTEFKILWEPDAGKYRFSVPSGATGLISISGYFMLSISRDQNAIKAKTLAPYVVFPELNLVSRTGDSDKFVAMKAYDGPIIQIHDGKNYAKLATQEYADDKALGMDITGASAGQIIKIKSVDANGKPTEWESADIVNAAPVQSVNGKNGAVNLTATDVGALPDTTEIPSKTSDIANDSGYITAADVPTKMSELDNDSNFATTLQVNAKYTKPSAGIPKTDLAANVQNSLDKADTALQSAPVTSVNGKTGAVTLAKSDVGLGNVDNVSINARMNRTTNVNAADSNYTTYMARGEALFPSETTPTVNGCIAWQYE